MSAAQYAREALERAERATPLDFAVMANYAVTPAEVSVMPGLDRVPAVRDFLDAARSDVPKLARAVIAVEELHRESWHAEYPAGPLYPAQYEPDGYCAGCDESWPCRTVRALSDALEVEA